MRYRHRLQEYVLFTLLGITRVLERADYHVPTKWYSVLDSLRASSAVLHRRIASLDEEVEQEFREKELMFDRRVGNEKFYSEKEVEELREKVNEIKINQMHS